jgi:hypothetical protein
MPSRSPGSSAVGAVLDDVLKRVDPEQQLRAYRLWTFWNDEVGAGIARRAQPTRFRNGILFVTVATHSWMQELQFMKETIRERLNARLGAELVRDMFFVSGAIDPAALAPSPETPAAALPRAADDEPSPPLPPLADRELAAAFTRIIAARARRAARTAVRTSAARPKR